MRACVNSRVAKRPPLTFYIVVLVGLLFGRFLHAANVAPRKSLAGHVPEVVSRLNPNGRLAGATKLRLAIGLPLRNQDILSNLLEATYDPASPQYHHYLSSDEFIEKFGPTPEDYQKVIDFAKVSGFNIISTHNDRMLVDVTAAVADVERAFQVTMRLYPHPTEARSFYAPELDPSVPADIAVADISGLDNYLRPRSKSVRRKISAFKSKNTSMEGSGPNGNLIAGDYRAAYAPGVMLTGAGQTLGLFEFDNYYPSDISEYESIAGITNPPPVQAVYLNGYSGQQSDGNGEVALDIEVAMSMAPGLLKIVCYETSAGKIGRAHV